MLLLLFGWVSAVFCAYPCDTLGQVYTACPAPWQDVGPGSYPWFHFIDNDTHTSPQIPREDKLGFGAGASQVMSRSTDGKTWFVGSVNGGIWKTEDIYSYRPHYENVLDGQHVRCYSISALTVDKTTIWAGCGGSTSSEMGYDWNVLNTGDWAGLLVSHDNGKTWDTVRAFPMNYYITGILAQGNNLIVATRSNYFNRDDGGVWKSDDGGVQWNRVLSSPIFFLEKDKTGKVVYAASPRRKDAVYRSVDGGTTWINWSEGIEWTGNRLPFYPTLAVNSNDTIFLGALTVNPQDSSDTLSDVFYREPSDKQWKRVAGNQPKLDDDAMPKDRMALLADPERPDILYVAGNGGSLCYRVSWATSSWAEMWGDEAGDTAPHPDCRNFAWEPINKTLLLTTDGGIYMRHKPREHGGNWFGVMGDIGEMEIYTASWDSRLNRWIGGAQDNGVLLTKPNAGATSVAYWVVEGDGTLTAVDNQHNPSRLYGSVQNLGGLAFIEGDTLTPIGVPVSKWFPDIEAFPFFAQPYALNSQNPELLVFWVNGTRGKQSAFYEAVIPAGVKNSSGIAFPKLLATTDGYVYTLQVGGFTDKQPDITVLIAMNSTHLYHRSRKTGGKLVTRKLPQSFAAPVVNSATPNGENWVLGPLSHFKTVSLAVSPADSDLIVVTGWSSVRTNSGEQSIWLSSDAGATWLNIDGNLERATGTISKVRPSGLLVIPFETLQTNAVLVGTVSGVYLTWTDLEHRGLWTRLGDCSNLPLSLVTGLTYEHYSDTLVAASLGRGVYVLHAATRALVLSREQQLSGTCNAPGFEVKYPFHDAPQTQYHPPQH